EERSATYVKAGQGLPIERRGTRAGHQYQLLGHSFSRLLAVEPYLITLTELSRALQVPVTAFFRRFEEERSATYVKAGQGLPIERRGTRAGHQYQLLGHSFSRLLAVEPYLITLSKDSDVFPIFQHEGVEFLFMLEGEVGYRHGDKTYLLQPGDSLYFDADVPHGPEELRKLPARYLSVICYARGAE
ncbi:MAG TPA: cupin domain-containing protein, partial [Dongiaceae bacterium]|nr:cupin domain-containing protein [Dongiaceae bacterium]